MRPLAIISNSSIRLAQYVRRWRLCFLTLTSLMLMFILVTGKAYSQPLNYLIIETGNEPFQDVNGANSGGLIADILASMLVYTDIKSRDIVVANSAEWNKVVLQNEYPGWVYFGSPYWFTNEVLAQATFSQKPLFKFNFHVLSLKNSLPIYQNKSSFSGRKLVLINEYSYGAFADYLAEFGQLEEVEVIRVDTHAEALQLIVSGRADYFIVYKPRARYFMKTLRVKSSQFNFAPFKDVPDRDVFLMFDSSLPDDIKQSLNDSLNRLRINGRLNGILAKYH